MDEITGGKIKLTRNEKTLLNSINEKSAESCITILGRLEKVSEDDEFLSLVKGLRKKLTIVVNNSIGGG